MNKHITVNFHNDYYYVNYQTELDQRKKRGTDFKLLLKVKTLIKHQERSS